MTRDLSDAVVVVAGAAGAAGPPTLEALLARGATVVAVDHAADRLDPVVARAAENAPAGRAVGLVVDLLDEDATREAMAGVLAEHGRIDGLFHLVGGWRGGAGIVEADLGDWALLHDLLIVTLQHTTRATHDALVTSGGRLAIVSTTQAQQPSATNAAYAAAKAAAEAWTLAVADSFAKAGERDQVAAATILQIKALLTDAMREARPDRKFPGYSHVDDVARELVGLFDVPATELNGARRSLTA
ncbi:MAG: SDR family oxidoreductase [Mobilicoccus sp.]|nr:SDR family oxidoreductase [Mobilicoccus sp.]